MRARCRPRLVLITVSVLATSVAFGQREVPPRGDLGLAEARIRDLFKAEYAERAREKRVELARKLIEVSESPSNDDATLYALLSEARRIAGEAGDLEVAFEAILRLGSSFSINPLAMKAETISSQPKARDREALKARYSRAIEVFDELWNEADIERARAMLKLAERGAKAVGSAWLATVAGRRAERVELFERFEKSYEAAELTLRSRPEDPRANLVVGLVRGLILGRWDAALRHLEKSPLAKIGGLEHDALGTTEEKIRAGDAWLDEALRASELDIGARRDRDHLADAMRWRAGHWYREARPGLDELARRALEKKLNTVSERYLSELEAFDTVVGWGGFGVDGDLGFDGLRIAVDGYPATRGIGMHTTRTGYAKGSFRVAKSFDFIEGIVAINDTAISIFRGRVVFRIVGDGRTLWASSRIDTRRPQQPFRVRISGVDILELQTDPDGSTFASGHAVWLDPILSRR